MNYHENKCNCGECFYCYMHQEYFHTSNQMLLESPHLIINVAEYVGPELTTSAAESIKQRLQTIPIRVCRSGYNE